MISVQSLRLALCNGCNKVAMEDLSIRKQHAAFVLERCLQEKVQTNTRLGDIVTTVVVCLAAESTQEGDSAWHL